MTGRAFYFGCWNRTGHYLFNPDGSFVGNAARIGPWGNEMDGGLCPNPGSATGFPTGPQVEGDALVHHRDGWTALAFWDRSVDARTNSCSVFIFDGALEAPVAISMAKAMFPEIWQRYRFEVRVLAVDDVRHDQQV
jgi:hypothetical protein